MLMRYAAGAAADLGSDGASPKRLFPLEAGERLGIKWGRRGSRIRGAVRGFGVGDGLQGVENEAATFAAVDFFAGFRAEFLHDVREDAQTAGAALIVAD